MNPRRRRAITRAIIAGIPKSKINSENIRKFLKKEKEKGRLNLTEENIQDILFPRGFVNKPVTSTSNVTIVEESVAEKVVEENVEEIIVEETAVEEIIVEEVTADVPSHDEMHGHELSLDNSKAELQAAAKDLGINFKKNFSKSKLLELINSN